MVLVLLQTGLPGIALTLTFGQLVRGVTMLCSYPNDSNCKYLVRVDLPDLRGRVHDTTLQHGRGRVRDPPLPGRRVDRHLPLQLV